MGEYKAEKVDYLFTQVHLDFGLFVFLIVNKPKECYNWNLTCISYFYGISLFRFQCLKS